MLSGLSAPAQAAGGAGARRWLVAIVAGAALLRLLVLLRFAPWLPAVETGMVLTSDAGDYHRLAQCLLQGSFCDNTIRTPGYPLYVAAIYAIVGAKPWAVLVTHIALDAATVAMAYRLGARLFSVPVGLAAAAWLAIEPTALFTSSSLLTDSLFTLLITTSLWALVAAIDTRRWLAGGLAVGGLVGLATLVRPVGQYVPVILLPFVLLAPGLARQARLGMAAAVVAAYFAAISPWLVRNQIAFDRVALSTVQNDALLNWDVAYHLSWRTGKSVDELRHEFDAELRRNGFVEAEDPYRWADGAGAMAKRLIREDTAGYLKSHLRGVLFMYTNLNMRRISEKLHIGPPAPNDEHAAASEAASRPPLAKAVGALVAAVQYGAYLMAFAGLALLAWRRERLFAAALLVVVCGYFSAVVGPIGQPRYRMPAMPSYLLLAGVATAALLARRRPSGAAAPASAR